ncbi:MAG: DUF3800 domain-containing protein [Chloroflexota bacterium]
MSTTHLAYSDESQQNIGRFHAIGMLSLEAEHAKSISSSIQSKLAQSEVDEAKWKKIKGARDRFAALKICDICVQEAHQKRLRVDVLIWDTQDERHKIVGRDDKKNLENMYIQLFKNVFRKRWPITSTWQVFPDENSAIDWSYLRNTLANTNRFTDQKPNLLSEEWTEISAHFGIHEIAAVSSRDTHLAQAADLFAGMGVFSYEHYDVYKTWERQNSSQPELFESNPPQSFSSKVEEHSRVLSNFFAQARKYSLGISLNSFGGLCTPNPSNPINFWFYRPQYQYDKAPIRKKK